jgi:hypothetical protein
VLRPLSVWGYGWGGCARRGPGAAARAPAGAHPPPPLLVRGWDMARSAVLVEDLVAGEQQQQQQQGKERRA